MVKLCTEGGAAGHVAVRFDTLLELAKTTQEGRGIIGKHMTTSLSAAGSIKNMRWSATGDQKKKLILDKKPAAGEVMEGTTISVAKLVDFAYEVLSTVEITGRERPQQRERTPKRPAHSSVGASHAVIGAEEVSETTAPAVEAQPHEDAPPPTAAEAAAPAACSAEEAETAPAVVVEDMWEAEAVGGAPVVSVDEPAGENKL